MTVYYVRSTDGNDADSGLSWANAKATLAGALALAVGGDRIWVSQNHAESQASAMTLTSAGTLASPVEVLCGNDAAEPPTALATSATVTTTGTNNITIVGFWYCYGITFSCATSGTGRLLRFDVTPTAAGGVWESCGFGFGVGTGASASIEIGETQSGEPCTMVWKNVTCTFRASSHIIKNRGSLIWDGGSVANTAPAALFGVGGSTSAGNVRVRGVDLSLLGGSSALVDATITTSKEFLFEQCKLGASVSLTSGTNSGHIIARLVNCDSSDTNYRYQKEDGNRGSVYSETTIVRTGGASDGTVTFSRRMVSTANTRFERPLCLDWIAIWNDTTGSSKTATIEIVNDGTTLQDDEVWIEVDYLGTSGYPISSRAMDRMTDILATAANQESSSETWTTTGLSSPVKQKLSVSFTPQEKGPLFARVCLAKTSQTIYVDPKVTVA